MAQGKLKIKTKVPNNVKIKNKQKKGGATTKRANCPKKQKIQDAHKLKQIITKTVNKAAEDEIRAMATKTSQNLSKAQKAVAEHNSKASTST